MATSSKVVAQFQAFDENGDGVISEEELGMVLRRLDRRWDEARLARLFRVLDLDRNGCVDYHEFVHWAFDGRRAVHTKDLDAFRHAVAMAPPRGHGESKADATAAKPFLEGFCHAIEMAPPRRHRESKADTTPAQPVLQGETERATCELQLELDTMTESSAVQSIDKYFAYAHANLKTLDWSEVQDLYSSEEQHPTVVRVVEALKVLLGEDVARWPEAPWKDVKVVLSDPHILKRLGSVDKDQIASKTLSTLERYTALNFCPGYVVEHSAVARCFSMWIFALWAYANSRDGVRAIRVLLHLELHGDEFHIYHIFKAYPSTWRGQTRVLAGTFHIEEAQAPSAEIIERIRGPLAEQLVLPADMLGLEFSPPDGQRLVRGHELQPLAGLFERDIKSQAELDAVTPTLEEALEALNGLEKRYFSELKSFPKPPHQVCLTMAAVCLLFGHKEDWVSSVQMMGDGTWIRNFGTYDTDNIPKKTIRKLEKYVYRSDFTPEELGKVARALRPLSMWVLAVYARAKLLEPALYLNIQSVRNATGGFRLSCVKLSGEEVAALDIEDTSAKVITDLKDSVSKSLGLERGVRVQFLLPDGRMIDTADEHISFAELFQL